MRRLFLLTIVVLVLVLVLVPGSGSAAALGEQRVLLMLVTWGLPLRDLGA